MSNEITLPEVQEFVARFWHDYDRGDFTALAAVVADEMEYLSRSDSGNCPFEELLAAELHGAAATLEWLSKHRDENPYPLRHHATNIFRVGTDGEVTRVRFYLYVNQVTNNVPFDVSSGVVDVGIRRSGDALVLTSMTVVLDAEDSIPFIEYRTKNAAAAQA